MQEEITIDLTLAERLIEHLLVILSSDLGQLSIEGLRVGHAQRDLAELYVAVMEAYLSE